MKTSVERVVSDRFLLQFREGVIKYRYWIYYLEYHRFIYVRKVGLPHS